MIHKLSFEGDGTHPFCPKCGDNLERFSEKLDESKLCSHVKLIYSDFASEIVFAHKSIDRIIEQSGGYEFLEASEWDLWIATQEGQNLTKEELENLNLRQKHPVESILTKVCQAYESTPNWLYVAVESKGFGCGPIFETVHVVYDLDVDV